MADPLFHRDGPVWVPTEHGRGPWSPETLHGGPVAALLAHELDAVASDGPLFPARLTVSLVRPLVMEPMQVRTRVVRAGRRTRLVEARLDRRPDHEPDDTTLVARAELQQIRAAPIVIDDDSPTRTWASVPMEQPEDHPEVEPAAINADVAFHLSSVRHRSADGFFEHLGPAVDWICIVSDLAPGLPLTPFERVAACSDFGNGVSASLPFDRFTFINPDLTVTLFRLPVDEWVRLDSATFVGHDGTGIADTALADRRGPIGRSIQTLLVDTR